MASELCKRGYQVSFTMGNHTPEADLMVLSPIKRKLFLIDVKGLYRQNPWLVKRKPERENLFYVLAYVPDGKPNQFFVMKQREAYRLIQAELTRLNRADDYSVTGFSWKLAIPHEDKWEKLPK